MIWKSYIKANPDSKFLPIIYPMVFYAGKNKYTAPLSILDLFESRDIAKTILFEGYNLINLKKIPDEIICKKKFLGLLES